MNSVHVYDDQGVLHSTPFEGQGFESNEEAALSIVNAMIDWSEGKGEGQEHYDNEELAAHAQELSELKSDLKNGVYEVESTDWYETELGFTFSAFTDANLSA